MAFAAVGVRPFGQQMAACSCAGGESSAKRLQGKPPDGKDDVLFVASFCAFVNPHSYIFPHSKFFLFFLKTNVWETKRFLGSRDKLGRASVQICGKVSTFGIPALYLQLWTSFLTTTKKPAPRFIPTSSELLTMKDGAIEQYTNIYNNVPLPTDITTSSRRAQHIPRNL